MRARTETVALIYYWMLCVLHQQRRPVVNSFANRGKHVARSAGAYARVSVWARGAEVPAGAPSCAKGTAAPVQKDEISIREVASGRAHFRIDTKINRRKKMAHLCALRGNMED